MKVCDLVVMLVNAATDNTNILDYDLSIRSADIPVVDVKIDDNNKKIIMEEYNE